MCSVPGCDELKILARGMCGPHYHHEWYMKSGKLDPLVHVFECLFCGAVTQSKAANSKYCALHKRASKRRRPATRNCVECESEFKPKTVNSRMCSARCAQREKTRKHRATRSLLQRSRALTLTANKFKITERDLRRSLFRQGRKCAYCVGDLNDLTWDHVVPLSRGGSHSIGNLVAACRSCNSRKHARTVMEFRVYCRNSEFKEIASDSRELAKYGFRSGRAMLVTNAAEDAADKEATNGND